MRRPAQDAVSKVGCVGSQAVWHVELLADHQELIPAVGELRWRDWGHAPEPEDLSWWVDVTGRESGRAELPVTFVALDSDGGIAGAVGLGQFDPAEREDRSPWVLGMIVAPEIRGQGTGRQLLDHLCRWAGEHGHDPVWVATGDYAVGFYRRCGWQVAETFVRSGEQIIVLSYRGG